MRSQCIQCQKIFEISESDLAFYEHISPVFAGKKYRIPPPKRCPKCREWNRLTFRNQSSLFPRPAYESGQIIYSMYPPTAPFPVMSNDDWFSDKWDALDYGTAYSADTPFMDRLLALSNVVPRYTAVNNIRAENCEYTNNVSDIKNCYLIFNTSYAEDCMYGEAMWASKDCTENTLTVDSELCYGCIYCTKCFNLQSSFNAENCSDSFYLANCRSCRNCFGCTNLRHKQYCIWNEQKTKVEYEAFIEQFNGSSHVQRKHYDQTFEKMMRSHPRPHTIMHQTEDCTGNCITQARNVTQSNFVQYGENDKYCYNIYDKTNDCQDFTFFGRTAELIYQCCSCGINISHLCFCYLCRDQSADLFYCISCDACSNCFGCVGLRHKKYCILNTQYTREEYEQLVPQIIDSMISRGEWGEYLPVRFNPIPYNRSIAYRHYPLTEAQALQAGYTWLDVDVKEFPGAIDAADLPDGLPKTDDPITVKSAISRQPFRITMQEIERYRTLNVPLPRITHEERLNERAQKIGGLELYERTCAKTGKPILTPYPPDAPYIIWDREEYENTFQ